MLETVILLLIVGAAVAWLLRFVITTLTAEQACRCQQGRCGAAEPPSQELISITPRAGQASGRDHP